MENKHLLLASFVPHAELDEALDRISSSANIPKDRIFVFRTDDIEDFILTYNIQQSSPKTVRFNKIWSDTISVHRKKETNTLFSLNALNELIKLENNGKLVLSYKINWEQYRNCFLLFRSGTLSVLQLELVKLNR